MATSSQFIQLRTELEDRFADLHQMLDVRRQQLLDKLTELEENYNKYEKHNAAINNLTVKIESMTEIINDDDDLLEDVQKLALAIFQKKLENLEKTKVNCVNIDNLELICVKSEFQIYFNSISISESKQVLDYSKKIAPILSKVNIGNSNGEINNPAGICIDNDQNEVYICDYNPAYGGSIHVFSLDGVSIKEFGEGYLKCPYGIALSSSDVFVTNSLGCHCLVKFNKNGTFVKKTGSEGSKDGQFNFPLGVCVANELVYVCDKLNNRIQAFTLDLHFTLTFTSNELSEPIGIRYYSNQLFVSKQTGSTIFVYSLEGAYIKSILLTGEGSRLNNVFHFTMDIAGNYFFSEYASNCIKIFSPSGEYIASLGKHHLLSPQGLAINKQGLIVCVCLKTGAVFQKY